MQDTTIKSANRNSSIDIFRYVCAIMVVAIHTEPFADINPTLGYVFTQIVPRIAVPFFFAISGYFYIKKLFDGKKPFLSYFKKLFITYVLWSAIYLLKDFAIVLYKGTSLLDFFLSYIKSFFVFGSSYHLWFFPAMFFCLIFVQLIYSIRCTKILIPLTLVLYFIGCLGCAYYEIFADVPVIGDFFSSSHFTLVRRVVLMGLPFFVSGYVVDRILSKFSDWLTNKRLLIFSGFSFALWLGEICLVYFLNLQNNIIITFGLYPLLIVTIILLVKNPLPRLKKPSRICLFMANFVYYSHPLFIFVIYRFLKWNTLLFLTVVLCSSLCGFIVYKINNRFLNRFVI